MDNKKTMYYDYNNKLKVKDKIFTPQNGVSLKEGIFKKAFDNNRTFLKTLNIDSMLYWFRVKNGRPAPGEPYRGHFEDNIKGQTAGMYMMGAGNTLKWQEDAELRNTIDEIVNCIEECSEPDGYLMAVPKKDFGRREYPHYVRIWLNYGLTAAAFGGNNKAFKILRKWQDWFNKCDELPIIKYLELSFQGIVASTSVYMTPAGTQDDIDVSVKYYEEDWRLAQFILKERDAIHIRKQPGREPHPHGTELESFEGYLDLYRATGKHYYLNAVMGAYELYKQDWQHHGGGIVMCENIDTYPGCYRLTPGKGYNELCCTSFWIGLNQRLHRLFPEEEKYVNEIEESLYNICIASQDGSTGIRYFSWLDGHKCESKKVTCCCGVGTKIYGSLPEYLYSVSEEDIYLDIYSASKLEWNHNGNIVCVETETNMPYNGAIRLKVSSSSPDRFKLHFRIPSWTDGIVDVRLNGIKVLEGKPGSYCKVDRIWSGKDNNSSSDIVEFTLPMTFRWRKYTGMNEIEGFDRYSFMYGPMLYTVKGNIEVNEQGTSFEIDKPYDRINEWIVPSTKPITFLIDGKPGYEWVPYFEIKDENFTCFPCFRKKANPY